MNYTIETTVAAEDLDLVDEVKLHAKINTGSVEDTLIQRYIQTAYSLFEEAANITLTPTEFRQYFYTFNSILPLARGKVISVEAVKYYDEDDVLTTLSGFNITTNVTGWRSDLTGIPATVYFPSYSPPTVSEYRLRKLYVEYTAGEYPDQDYLPHDITQAIILAASHMYLNRESHTDITYNELPMGFYNIALKYKTGLHSL